MASLSTYSTITVTKEGMFFILAIDTDDDGDYETRKISLGSVRLSMYDTNSNIFKESKGADVASATALVLGSDGNYFTITGVTAITSISPIRIGTRVTLEFAGILVLTHDGDNIVLPGGKNITTAVGDYAEFREYTTGKWKCISYTRGGTQVPIITSVTPKYLNAVPQALSGPGAVDLVAPITNVTTVGATDALTLADGLEDGMMKCINHVVDGGGYILTPTNLLDGTTITVTDVGVSISLMWVASSGGWRLVSQAGVATIA
jgi:hypothetical protein